MIFKNTKMLTVFFVLMFCIMSFPFFTVKNQIVLSNENPDREWNSDWAYQQNIDVFIDTADEAALFQPIDIKLDFTFNCWAINETIHSIRVCCWDGQQWHELESQIYDLNYSDDTHIRSCGLVFLIPSFADGDEQYVVYYHDEETPAPNYEDHVSVKDSYYYYEPISGIAVEGDYYEIRQDDEVVYGVGQKGKVMNRRLSQIAIRMKPGSEKFDILNTDLLTSFCFAYQNGADDEDEIASDQRLIAKNIIIDGNLMVEFLIESESENGQLKSSNIYRYYYNPSEKKRIEAHVNHEVTAEAKVTGVENADGRYGAIISFHSKSASMKKMVFGSILPFIHLFGENNRVNEYSIDTDPESSTREWSISYNDDCDIGSEAWLSYDEGEEGITHGILFSKHTDIISNASFERDGIELKSTGKEYLDLVGAEIDYISIAFGRNAFERSQGHDLIIDKGLKVEFDAAFVTFQNATYEDVRKEQRMYKTLIDHRHQIDEEFDAKQNIHTLTVIPHLTGRIFSFPFLQNKTGLPLPVVKAELFMNETFVAEKTMQKTLFGVSTIKFPKLSPGTYLVKLYREYANVSKKYIGFGTVDIQRDTSLHVYCTWQKNIELKVSDQFNHYIENVTIELLHNTIPVTRTISKNYTNITLFAPFNLFQSYVTDDFRNVTVQDIFKKSNPYTLYAYYKGFRIFNTTVKWFSRPIQISQNLYDLEIIIKDDNGMPPDVELKPYLISDEMRVPQEIHPSISEKGIYQFQNLPPATYTLFFSFGGYTKTKTIIIPAGTDSLHVLFSYNVDVSFSLLNNRGEPFFDESLKLRISRDGVSVKGAVEPSEVVSLPPGSYAVSVYNVENRRIGSKTIEVKHERNVEIVTNRSSLLFIIVTFFSLVLFAELCLLVVFKKISINTFLKLGVLLIVIASLLQPWWVLHAEDRQTDDEKTSIMYLYPPKMIDEYIIDDTQYLSQATIPEMFTDFLGLLLLIIFIGIVFMISSFIPNVILGKRYAWVLSAVSIIFVTIVAVAFSMGMRRICEISLGSLQGSGILEIMAPTGKTMYMSAEWGLGLGFYLVIFAAVVSFLAGIIDVLRRKDILQKIMKKC